MTDKTKYTAEDFQSSHFARHPDGRIAARMDPYDKEQWRVFHDIGWMTDVDIARGDWAPVRDPAPITLEALEAAWEQAEVDESCSAGDVLIRKTGYGYDVTTAQMAGLVAIGQRILQRAPRRPEGAEALAEVMRELAGHALSQRAVDEYADRLAERGVRLVAGDE